MQQLSVAECVAFGWGTFKKRPWFFIGVVIVVFIVSSITSALPRDNGMVVFALTIVALAINVLVEMGLIAFALKAHDGVEKVTFHNLWHPQSFWSYVGVKILTALIVLVGLVLLVVPGIIAALALLFATYLVIDRALGPIEALKESARLTKGHRWALFMLLLAVIGLNILGVLALMIGLLVSVPVSLLAIAHAYRSLSSSAAA